MSTTIQDNPNINKWLKYRSVTAPKKVVDVQVQRSRVLNYIRLRKEGWKGKLLYKRAKIEHGQAVKLAVQLGIDMGGIK